AEAVLPEGAREFAEQVIIAEIQGIRAAVALCRPGRDITDLHRTQGLLALQPQTVSLRGVTQRCGSLLEFHQIAETGELADRQLPGDIGEEGVTGETAIIRTFHAIGTEDAVHPVHVTQVDADVGDGPVHYAQCIEGLLVLAPAYIADKTM